MNRPDGKKKRIAVLASHPIEQQGPFFKELSAHSDIELKVFYFWKFGVDKATYDKEFGKAIQWDIPLLDGYDFKFLANISPRPTSSYFFGEVNPGIIPAIFRGRYDAVIIYGWSSASAWMGYFSSILSSTPFFIRAETPLNQDRLKTGFWRPIRRFILKWLFERASGFLYIGEENHKFYESYGVSSDKLYFTPYAVDNARFMAEADRLIPEKNNLRLEFGIDPDDVIILSLGKLIDKKRPMDLLRAYEGIKSERKSLVFVGDGLLRSQLEEYVAKKELKNVRFMGFRNQTEIGKFYAMADIFAFPSQAGDTWGFVLNEAMCFGLPIVISDIVGSVPDLVRHAENGFVFKLGDVSGLSGFLEKLILNSELRSSFGATSRQIVKEYSYEKDISSIVEAIEDMSENKK